MATSDIRSRMEMSERADMIMIREALEIEVRESNTVRVFRVSEYIEEESTSQEIMLKISGGTNSIASPTQLTFLRGMEYLIYLVEVPTINRMNDDKTYEILYGSWGKDYLENVDNEFISFLRQKYGSTYHYWIDSDLGSLSYSFKYSVKDGDIADSDYPREISSGLINLIRNGVLVGVTGLIVLLYVRFRIRESSK